jgi:hypothetical protein
MDLRSLNSWGTVAMVAAGLLAGVAASGCAEDEQPQAAARVGTATITASHLDRDAEAARRIRAQNPQLRITLSRRAVLSRLIVNEWHRQEAIARGVRLPEGGLTDDRRRTLIFEGLSRAALAGQHFPVTENELRAYYLAHRSELARPANRVAQFIETRTKARAAAAIHAFKAGKSWPSIRARYGDGVPAVTGDRTGFTSISQGTGQLPELLDEAVFRAPRKTVVGPVKANGIWHIFYVHDVTKANPPTLRQSRQRIATEIRAEKSSAYLERFITHLAVKYKPRTTCSKSLVVPQCRNSQDSKS